jgi:hypothetical protein
MTSNSFVSELLKEELRFKTRLPDDKIEDITNAFMTRLQAKRHAVVLTFLNDVMFDAIKSQQPEIDFKTANSLYTSAIKEYTTPIKPINQSTQEEWYSR